MFGTKRQTQPQEVFIQPVDTTSMMVPPDSMLAAQTSETPQTQTVTIEEPKQEQQPVTKIEEPKPKPKPKREAAQERKREVQAEPKQETIKPVKQPAGSGNYTIYAGSYSSKNTASEEAGRWSDAGYQAGILQKSRLVSRQKNSKMRLKADIGLTLLSKRPFSLLALTMFF
jgi:outer membrane biosynthesis protein TonB